MASLKIEGTVLTPASGDAYAAALERNSALSQLPAGLVVQPASYADVAAALAFARAQAPPLEVAVKCGGTHSATWASSAGGLVLDLAPLNRVALADDRKSISVQGGARWGDVYEVTARERVDVAGSPLWFIGVGGFSTGGGYGPLMGEHGLAIDNLLEATVVLADGRIVKTSKDEEPDLFWAIRGGGGQFGVVVELVFKVHPYAGPFGAGVLAFPGTEIEKVVHAIKTWKDSMSPAEKLTISFSRPAPHFKPSVTLLPMVLHDTDGERSAKVLAPFRTGALKPVFEKVASVPDLNTASHGADASLKSAPRRLIIRGTITSDFTPALVLAVWQKWVAFTETSEDVRGSAVMFDVTHPGKLTAVGAADTALPLRVPHYWMAIQGRSTTDEGVAAASAWTKDLAEFVRQKNTELSGTDLGWFINMCQGDERPEDVFGANLPRLRKLKAKYDPHKVFSKGVVIEPLAE
ncbi:FAD-binding domain-containing protein [Phanerochaete sordida]|uniref:FAD-binding domain-containing protein n=1 Tax=Phanerochaete sordida TaxID=48140 RepID=A0A9P3GHW8_9APHY|nr:FAD-binding domain-containing protein [Phanerochaete sordida]